VPTDTEQTQPITHPVVGTIVEAAGDLAASQFRELFGDPADRH
jgi:hypothetical protein